jgi:gamma-glutamyltranspeptidase/glutathione hydrolase
MIAERGFKIDSSYAQRLAATADELRRFEASRSIFLRPDGSPYPEGALLKQPDLAASYRSVAEQGIGWFYGGPFARRTEQWMTENGGLVKSDDFASYHARVREAVTNSYRGYTIIGFPPPSSGGVHVAEILNILEHFDLRKMGAGSADLIHLVAEAMKLAFADRAFWLGDPDFAAVPRGLITKAYAAKLVRRISMDRVMSVDLHGTPENASGDLFGRHTTHFCMADRAGNWVACTATINTSFGSKVVIPGTGVIMNNQMDDFAIQPGAANFFGLIGAEANSVSAGKRPLSSMSPTIVLKDGRPIFSVGAAGGPTIISQTVLAIINTIDFGMPVEAALAQPRFHHQWRPDELKIERKAGPGVLKELARRGHHVVPVEALGAAQAISLTIGEGTFAGAADPRGGGKASGF